MSEETKRLLEACKAVLATLVDTDLGGLVLWINPPYQLPMVHETAQERLIAVIADTERSDPIELLQQCQRAPDITERATP